MGESLAVVGGSPLHSRVTPYGEGMCLDGSSEHFPESIIPQQQKSPCKKEEAI